MADAALKKLMHYVALAPAITDAQSAEFDRNVDTLANAAWVEMEELGDATERSNRASEIYGTQRASMEGRPVRRTSMKQTRPPSRFERLENERSYDELNRRITNHQKEN